ncbi:DUF423 domain-containing protein [Marinagarivorans algicola]|uniref:DUF423 domain-containing protein n=1 Tax=Marinagarivorans algicola TaxID=1513270 RepID=UPI0006B97C9D|nr:DUF423 domain-containing protein [Marinagarivorans algicola]
MPAYFGIINMIKMFLIFAAMNGALAVVLGAFGAHALKQSLSVLALQTWHTAVQYHFVHVLALLFVGLLLKVTRPLLPGKVAGVAFMLGILLFSGSLYGLALSGSTWLGPITPLGGLCLIVGWIALFVQIWRMQP